MVHTTAGWPMNIWALRPITLEVRSKMAALDCSGCLLRCAVMHGTSALLQALCLLFIARI